MFGVPVRMVLKGYNYALSTTGNAGSINCTGPPATRCSPPPAPTQPARGKQTTCKNYAVSAST
jgi:hypothetical protein